MDTSILNSTKKILGLAADDDSFDLDVITAINSAFSTLTDLGVGPAEGFFIDDSGDEEWADVDAELSAVQLNQLKTFVYLSVRLIFDPPQTSFALDALQKQIVEHQWRLNVRREATEWVDPDPPEVVYE
jgi:hypothetical protein